MILTLDKSIEKLICELPPCIFKFKYILNRRWPFLYPHRRERVADIIIMREINKFNVNICDLLDNENHRKEIIFTVPIINVIEALIFEYGNQEKIFENISHGLALYRLASEGIITGSLSTKIRSLYFLRDKILNDNYFGNMCKYNMPCNYFEANTTLVELENSLFLHFKAKRKKDTYLKFQEIFI
ncbi:hypothetical protein DSN97_01590 [Deferribacteraceae bacterium V6Fe1]|nr:hypothetical protein DSN97_01590 [Deferribacteraceae bacterium V6Fe1]